MRMLSPSTLPETISSFLDEVELLDLAEELERERHTRPAVACGGRPLSARNKKLSSTDRRKRDRVLLLHRVEQLQLQLQRIRLQKLQDLQEHRKQQCQICDTNRSRDANSQLRHALAVEVRRTRKAAILLQILSAPMKTLTYADPSPGLQISQPRRDAAVFETLKQKISDDWTRLTQDWDQGRFSTGSTEAVDTTVSPDGTVLTHQSTRFFPFDIPTISATIWRVAQSSLQSGSHKTMVQAESDLLVFKEQLTIHPAGHDDVMLCIRVIIKRAIHKSHSVLIWETACDWSVPSSTQWSTTKESGWVVVRPANAGVNIFQSFMKTTLIESSLVWAQLVQNSGVELPLLVPCSHQVMLSRIQRVENRLFDDVMPEGVRV